LREKCVAFFECDAFFADYAGYEYDCNTGDCMSCVTGKYKSAAGNLGYYTGCGPVR
jgi:hypothetical protein